MGKPQGSLTRRTTMTTHRHSVGRKTSPTYRSWTMMRVRCSDPKCDFWSDYGGRGIKVCARWDKFENFLADMGERPEGTSIDRWPDQDGNYEPGNCRWATAKEQMRNTRRAT